MYRAGDFLLPSSSLSLVPTTSGRLDRINKVPTAGVIVSRLPGVMVECSQTSSLDEQAAAMYSLSTPLPLSIPKQVFSIH